MKLRAVQSSAVFSLVAALMFLPVVASAQITTFVPPPRKVDSVKQAIVAEQRVRSDSVARMTLTDMKAWVDSAVGAVETAANVVDTTVAAIPATTDTRRPVSATKETTTFSDGAIAPDTASPLPLLALAGLICLVLGVVMLAGRRRA